MKKTHELIHLQRFADVCPFFPSGRIEATERPDFIVHAQGRILGIEHTRVFQPGPFHGGSLQAQDSLAQKIVDRAKQLYMQAHGQPLHVWILFQPRLGMSPKEVPVIAERIVLLVKEADVESGTHILLKPTTKNWSRFPEQVVFIQIYHHPEGRDHHWDCLSAGFGAELVPEHIQSEINRKESRLRSYRARCSEVWLLLVADDFRVPSMIDLSETALIRRYETRFDRVFLFWNFDQRFVELQLRRAS